MKRSIFAIVRVAVSSLLIFLMVAPAAKIISPIFPLVDISGFPEIIRNAGKGFLLLAIILSLVSAVMLAWRWKIVTLNHNLAFPFLLRLTFIGMFFNNFLPTGAGGDVVKGYYLLKGQERKLDLGISILMDRLVGILSILTMGFIALLFSPHLPKTAVCLLAVIYISALFFLLISAWPGLGRILGKIFFFSAWGKPAKSVRHFYYGVHTYLQNPAPLLQALCVSFGGQLLIIGSNYLITLSLRAPVSLSSFFTSIPLIWAFAAIPSLGGLGVRETGYLFFFQGQMGRENAFALALIILSFSLLNSIIGGLIYFLGGGKWQKKN
ncbi:MAG: lysylphosphatidylglycerol synthase transmembrane domain-containing protein [Candidatus Omnitrophica bacterium]|nr:lysylphosphatidylglycerol synthase transmembrane domain-containing protein [Candidatus Omnitrophota bacterium]